MQRFPYLGRSLTPPNADAPPAVVTFSVAFARPAASPPRKRFIVKPGRKGMSLAPEAAHMAERPPKINS